MWLRSKQVDMTEKLYNFFTTDSYYGTNIMFYKLDNPEATFSILHLCENARLRARGQEIVQAYYYCIAANICNIYFDLQNIL